MLVVAALLVGCKQHPSPPPVRPVLSVVVAPRVERTFGFTGTVEPRYRVNLGFRVLGRMIARDVEVGDQVKAGQEVAAIESVALELAVRSAIADLSSARAQLANSTGAEGRQRVLVERNVVPQAQFESAQQAQSTAAASARRAEANLEKAREQLTYAHLRSDIDGVVTAVGAQAGQVVTAGQSVVTVARPDIREAVVDVPEDVARDLKPGTSFDVALQLDPAIRVAGAVREVGPQADAATRTRRVLITLPGATEVFRLGTTITARLVVPVAPIIELPISALLEKDGKAFVWIIDPAPAPAEVPAEASTATPAEVPAEVSVALREIKVAARDDAVFQVTDGLASGARVVTAGVHSLTAGQRIKLPARGAR